MWTTELKTAERPESSVTNCYIQFRKRGWGRRGKSESNDEETDGKDALRCQLATATG
jgi:hypothetical protein